MRASQPALWALLKAAGTPLVGPVRKVPRLGWVVTDPILARNILNDHGHFTLLGEGGVGHLWQQVLGDYVLRIFDGPGHADLRKRGRDLFTDANSGPLVEAVAGPVVDAMAERLAAGATVDVARTARTVVGRMMADLLGLRMPDDAPDAAYLEVFATGERLASLALGSTASTVLKPQTVAEAKTIIAKLTRDVPESYATAPPSTLLGRCREAGISLEEARGLASLLLVAGTETAASAMGRTVALLHDTGQQHALLGDRSLLADAVREGLRVTTPAPVIGRHVSQDVEIGGRRMRSGERVLMLTYTANNAAGRFDLRRPYDPETRQLWFGGGRHLCLGAPVARAEVARMLSGVLASGRPYRVVERRYARGVLIPSYASLRIAVL
ncbi:cytochrome P450 [Catenulispora rubra]|uniref:cytochrome P450 n=1 Tax=Catenulispora rubra TaxID=280293 RepID=UPI001E2F7E2F|nr:cytochrome P450 [Catenulispora rubra]